MYDFSARRVLPRKDVLSIVGRHKWDKKDLPETYYPYVTTMLEIVGKASGKMQSMIPKHLHGKVWIALVDVLMKAWTGEPFEHHGETVQVLPKPFTSPHPQIMIGGSAKASARRAARLGLPLYMNGNPPGIKELYEELCAENGTVPFCIAPEEAPQLFITEDPDRAWAELGEHFMLEARTYADWQPEGQNSPVHSHAMTVDDLREEGIYRFLTPDQAREFVAGAGSCTLHPLVGGMPIDEAWRSVELFADAVLSGDS